MDEPKSRRESRVTLSQFMQPPEANARGNVHGGAIVRLVDEAGALAAMRHARRPVVTVAIDSITFLEPVMVGHVLTLEAELTYVGRTSIETKVEVTAENVLTGEHTRTNTAYAVYVALDDQGRPCPVPQLVDETDEDRRITAEAQERRRHRLEQRGR
ncbi:MAG: acyl-CoA thioesterase [Pirellulales bacterium]